jgi:hypothetical protein
MRNVERPAFQDLPGLHGPVETRSLLEKPSVVRSSQKYAKTLLTAHKNPIVGRVRVNPERMENDD